MKGTATLAITVLSLIAGGSLLEVLGRNSAQPQWVLNIVGATREFKLHHPGWPKTRADLEPYDADHSYDRCHPEFRPISDSQAYLVTDGWNFVFPTRDRHLLTFHSDTQLTY